MSEFWERKMKTHFKLFDFNGDGVITEEDFRMMGLRFAEAQGADADRREELLKGYHEMWLMWTNGAGGDDKQSLSLSGFIKTFRSHLQDPEPYKQAFKKFIRIMFDLLDVNKDGFLQEDELFSDDENNPYNLFFGPLE